ncbi:hypothetical protein [Moraxella lacunata]|uniref:hypothetical protein n=1 Tax=Moraxella lacunata TaxID=477 RepID=UPI003EE004FD
MGDKIQNKKVILTQNHLFFNKNHTNSCKFVILMLTLSIFKNNGKYHATVKPRTPTQPHHHRTPRRGLWQHRPHQARR